MGIVLFLLYLFLCLGAYSLFLILFKNRYTTYYQLDDIIDTNDETYAVYLPENRWKEYVKDYTVYINDEYRFRIFEMTLTPLYPVTIWFDEGVLEDTRSEIAAIAGESDPQGRFQISSDDQLMECFQAAVGGKKVQYIIRQMLRNVKIESQGDTNMLPGEYVDIFTYEDDRQIWW